MGVFVSPLSTDVRHQDYDRVPSLTPMTDAKHQFYIVVLFTGLCLMLIYISDIRLRGVQMLNAITIARQ